MLLGRKRSWWEWRRGSWVRLIELEYDNCYEHEFWGLRKRISRFLI